jgi:TRAP-type transport system periplasmic protein
MLGKKRRVTKKGFTGKVHVSIRFSMLLIILAGGLTLGAGSVLSAPATLKFATTIPPTHPIVTQVFDPWAKKVNEASNGELEIQVINGPTLANAANVWERTLNQVADIGWGIHGAVGLPFPKSTVSSLPFTVEDLTTGSVALWRIYANGLIADEYKDLKVLSLVVTPTSLLISKKPVNSLEDVKGMKLRVANKIASDVVMALGGSPISVPATETYQALQRGVIDGSIAGWVLINGFMLYEVVNYYVEGVPLGDAPGFVVMNRKSYENLSPKAKETLDRFSGETFSRDFGAFFKSDMERGRERVKAMPNQHIVTLNPQEKERWKKVLEVMIKDWVAKTPNGQQLIDGFRSEIKKVTQ